jgi:hypothetical protein
MFEIPILGGTPERTIVVQTSKGTSIENAQSAEPDNQQKLVFQAIIEQHPQWKERKPPCGIYNCFGHVWASRRTSIYESEEIDKILNDDSIRSLHEQELPLPGDVVVYRDQTDAAKIFHVARIVEIKQIAGINGGVGIPWSLSKLNDSAGEVLHPIDDMHLPPFTTEIWTDRA